MKVYIGPYVKWIGPYQIAEWVPFLNEDQKHNLGAWLASTWVNRLCECFYSKCERKIKVRIDEYDTWSMDNTLAHIILPMLKQLKATKHGSPMVDDEDVPEHMRHSDDTEGHDNWIHYKWEWVLNEIIWAFEQELDDSWEDQFRHGKAEYVYTPVNPKQEYTEVPEFINDDDMKSEWVRMDQVNSDYWFDWDGYKEYSDRIQNGFRLFGKYYQGLWD